MRRKAVSPVIAVLLLIVIAVAAALLAYVWITGYVGTLESGTTPAQIQEKIRIEAVKISGTTLASVYVRNIGDTTITLSAVYLIDASTGGVISSTTVSGTLNPGSVTALDAGLGTLSAGETYVVKVVTENGVEATYTFTYSG